MSSTYNPCSSTALVLSATHPGKIYFDPLFAIAASSAKYWFFHGPSKFPFVGGEAKYNTDVDQAFKDWYHHKEFVQLETLIYAVLCIGCLVALVAVCVLVFKVCNKAIDKW